jgi:uncharacterized GH25 family protein
MSPKVASLVVLGLAALVAVALWLAGFYEPEEPQGPPLRSSSGQARDADEDDSDGGKLPPVPTRDPIESVRFDPSRDGPESGSDPIPSASGGYRLIGRVVSEDGPVVSATVDLIEDNTEMEGVHQLGSLRESVATDAEGGFAFEGLELGERVILRASHPDYTMAVSSGIDARRPATLRQVLRVGRGMSVRGRVLHEDGRSLSGAEVAVYDLRIQAYEPEDQIERRVTTGPDGTYELGGLGQGIKRIVASMEGMASEIRSTLSVPVPEGGAVDFVMKPGFGIEGKTMELGTGAPIEGIRVMVRPLQANVRGAPHVESVLSDENGAWRVSGLTSGNCEVWARGPTHLPSARQVAQAGTTGVVLELAQAARLEGRVVDELTSSPVTDYSLFITANPDFVIGSKANRVRVKDPEGKFTFVGVQAMASLYLVVRSPLHAETVFGPISIGQGEQVTGLLIAAKPGFVVTGSVVDGAGNGIEGAKVSLRRNNLANTGDATAMFFGPLMASQAAQRGAVTDAEGRYRVSALRDGRWSLTAIHPEYATEREVDVEVSDRDVEAIPLTLQKAGGVRGVVKTKEGEPDGRARVNLANVNNASIKFEATTDSDGNFEILGIPPGAYTVRVVQRAGVVDLGGLLAGAAGGTPAKSLVVAAGQVVAIDP